jgi:hypothetical protein
LLDEEGRGGADRGRLKVARWAKSGVRSAAEEEVEAEGGRRVG